MAGNRQKKWLSLQEAADQLGVHFTTVRRWVDQGAIPTLLTPGGHRRFSPEDLEEFARKHRRHYIREGIEDSWQRHALNHTRDAIHMTRSTWSSRFGSETSIELRRLGKQLMDVMMQFISAEDLQAHRLLDQAEEIGRHYGEIMVRGKMSLPDMLNSISFFKISLVEATVSMPESQAKPQLNSQIIRRINEVMGAVELALAAVYERHH